MEINRFYRVKSNVSKWVQRSYNIIGICYNERVIILIIIAYYKLGRWYRELILLGQVGFCVVCGFYGQKTKCI